MSAISTGFYTRRISRVHSLHPWTKLIYAFCILVGSFGAPSIWFPISFFLLALGLVLLGKIGKVYLMIMVKTIPLFAALFIIQSLYNPGRLTPLFTFGPITIWREGVQFASLVSARLLAIISSMVILVVTTRPADLVAGLEDHGISHRFGYAILLILQFAPEMQRRVGTIMDAQRARGIETTGNFVQRIRAFLPILGPLVTTLLLGIETRALALEARGFSIPGKRTRIYPLTETRFEKTGRWVMIFTTAGILIYRIIM